MSQRISLTRIIALHWYGFRQIFDVEDNILISGAFGTGKSALLDLIQYVLLGEHWKANRAAAGNARGRDLVGYCLGDTNQTRNGQRHFLRNNGITLVALEFTKHAENKRQAPPRETWGIRLEYSSPEAAPKHTYFCVPERLEYTHLAPGGKLLPEDAFRAWIRREYGNDCLFARQRDYLEEMAAPRHLNFDVTAFLRTFPKAIAFEIEDNVEKFIREFILEESPLEVQEVRSSLRAYDETRHRLERQEDEAAHLRRIVAQHTRYESSRREEAVLQHTGHALRLVQAEERRAEQAAKLQQMEQAHADDLRELAKADAEVSSITRLLDQVRFEIGKDPQAVEIAKLEAQRQELQAKVTGLREAQQSIRKQLDDRQYRWTNWLKHGEKLPLASLSRLLGIDPAPLAQLQTGSDQERLAALPKLATQFNEIWRGVEQLVAPARNELAEAEKRLRQLAKDLEDLDRGQAPGSFPLLAAVRQKLGTRVEQLGRLIEVKPEAERWWPALEMFLGRQRWVLVVNNAADYREALEILRRSTPGREPESLLHPEEARQLHDKHVPNSLFDKVEVANPVARHYVKHLLGGIQCVETIEELEAAEVGRAITPEGVFKQAPLRRRLRPISSGELTLGREGLQRMRAAKQKEQAETRRAIQLLNQQLNDVKAWLDSGQHGGLADAALPDRAAELPALPEWESSLRQMRATIELLSTPERAERQQQLTRLEHDHREALYRTAALRERNNNFELSAKPVREAIERASEDAQNCRLKREASRVELGRRFAGILDTELAATANQFRAEFAKWPDSFLALQEQEKAAGQAAIEARGLRLQERTALANARDEHGNLRHPQYQVDFPAEDESNDAWASRLRALETIELEKSRQLAADRKRDWERRLEENVLNELNRRINNAQLTIRQLDKYLSQPIGKHRYRISQRRDNAGYGAIWRLLDTGLEATDPLAAAVPGDEIERAKNELMKAVDATDKGDERALRLLDYRNYHHYDIEMVAADKPEAPPISIGRSGRNLSGGENQAPFFISMLAAFRRVYDRGDRHSSRSQQLGLVLMDEAFSKLSGDGIEDCLALARNFQLQLIMAFPPERLGVMVPHAQTVVICQKEVARDADGYVKRIDNVPLITTMAEAMDALT